MGVSMKRSAPVTIAGLFLLFNSQCAALADDTYYPYQMYEEFHRKPAPEPPQPPPQGQQQPPAGVKPPARAMEQAAVQPAPEFLFPQELGFGVAIGVPYDMFYLSEVYYLVDGSNWYRSSSYEGPWTALALRQLPPVLRKHDLATIRQLRNREFRKFWEDRDHYQGRHFTPGRKLQEKPKARETPPVPRGPN